MSENTIEQELFIEKQTIETIKTAIATSKRTLMNDGVLLICWGLVFSMNFFWKYYESIELTSRLMRSFMNIFNIATGIGAIVLTINFIFFRKKRVKTYTAISTRFVWIGIIIASNLNVIVTKSFLAEVNFELLHPLQMVLIGFALFVTGGIYRYYALCISGIIMWAAASIAAGYELNTQFLIRAIADFVCFVIPGILMYSSLKK